MALSTLTQKDRNWYILKGYIIEEDRAHRVFSFDGVVHREDGPAVEWNDGTKCWYSYGKRHRMAAAAVIYPDGIKE